MKRTISDNTGRLIHLMEKCNDFYSEVLKTLSEVYGDKQAQILMQDSFDREFLEMKKRLEDFTMQSISENIQTLDSNCI